MSSGTQRRQADRTILTGGLGRVLLGAIIVGFALAAIQIVAVSKLKHEIDHWAWTSEINAIRDRLTTGTRELLLDETSTALSDVLETFQQLRGAINAYDGAPEDHLQHHHFAIMEEEARAFFLQAEDARLAMAPHRDAIVRSVDNLQTLSVGWATQIRNEERNIVQEYERLDAQSRQIDGLKRSLTAVLLEAQQLQQQLIAVERLIGSASDEITQSSVAALNGSRLPALCAPGVAETDMRICSPSPARALSALKRLQDGAPSEIPQNVSLAIMGLQGYVRAGQGRLDQLATDGADVLDQMRRVQQRLSELRGLSSSLVRINRVLLDLDGLSERSMATHTELDENDRRVRSYVSQIYIRMSGLMKADSGLEGDPAVVEASRDSINSNWAALHALSLQRVDALDAFADTMAALSSEIADHALQVRSDTILMVNLYATSFLTLGGLLIASTVGLALLARRRFVVPLAQVTRTIFDLARGRLDQRVVLPERAFGFDTLGTALEQLRQEMLERHRLAESNRAQQVIIESNLEELQRSSQDLAWMAMHDPLTGLANRRQADADLQELTTANAKAQTDFCVMQVDIDRFKTINDALGHAAGDFVLTTASAIFKDCAGPKSRCYRIGGDEFLIVWSGVYTTAQAEAIAERLIRLIKAPMDFNGHRCNVGASIGIALGRDAGFDAMQAAINADLALYQVKRSGRGTYSFFTEDLADLTTRTKALSDRLVAAIDQKKFQPFYQPQFDARTRNLRGVEVLCRWHEPDMGWISPGEFLEVAEDLGVVAMIDEILFDKVAKDLETLAAQGLSLPKVSFNVTADRLLRAGLAHDLSSRIGAHTTIALELLESMSLDNPPESVRWAIDDLMAHGIEIEIDDFGSDRASLAGLMAINPQAMKIDRSIVIPIVESVRHLDLVKKIIDIGAALNVEVVAEGVETEEHALRLASLGCGVLQGYGLARPMPFDDLIVHCQVNETGAAKALRSIA